MRLTFSIGLVFLLLPVNAFAEEEEEDEAKTISEEIEGHTQFGGLFPLYQDPEEGDVQMEIHADQMEKEYIYFSQTMDGVLEAYHFRGSYRKTAVISIRKHFDRIEFVENNTRFYFDPESPLSRASKANISESILISLPILAEEADEDGKPRYLVSADSIFLEEQLQQISPSPNPDYSGPRFSLGSLDGDKTKFHELRNYEDNTDLVVDYVYHNDKPTVWGSSAVTNARNVTLRIRHSLIEMPVNSYTPRNDDFRVGYFMQKSDDMTSMDYAPYRDYINRWHLESAKPELDLSPPKEPIVWWIENTTPHEFREAVAEGVLAWNKAFESAGFSNAIEVNVQPDDADWDAGDINHNVLRWTSSPRPPFGGYGPSFVNPRTGEIIGADIMLELVYITNRVRYEELLNPTGNLLEPPEKPFLLPPNPHRCSHSTFLMEQMALGQSILGLQKATELEKSRLLKEGIKHLVLHEVGHTLGLNHNMKASTNLPYVDLHNTEITDVQGLAGSVMDYTPINLATNDNIQGKYFSDLPGAYDHWAIEYGYRPPLSDPKEESERVDALLSRSLEPLLTFGNDADDMRSPSNGIDPRVMIGDLSDNPIEWALGQAEIADAMMADILTQRESDHDSFEQLVSQFYTLVSLKTGAARTITNYIGGVYVERGTVDQFTENRHPFTPVDRKTQVAAMKWLGKEFFAPKAFEIDENILASLQSQRRGFEFFGRTEDPKINQMIFWRQDMVLYDLLHSTTLTRMSNTELYGNKYSVSEMMNDLTEAVMFPDLLGNTTALRRELQLSYVNYLISIHHNSNEMYDATAKAAATRQLTVINGACRKRILTTSSKSTRDHRLMLRAHIRSETNL